MTILARPSEWARTSNATASSASVAGGSHHYFAFLSYSHRNQAIADWLHQALERFVVPSHLVGRITDHGAVPKRLTPIFRDLNELPASNDLGVEIRSAIA
jgi:eukaryotic-like serine/threonine-protein kinase